MSIPSEYETLGSDSSLLKMTGVGMPPYAARGITQTLAHIDGAAQLHRTINGDLADFSFEQFRKYVSTVTAADQRPPALDGIWPGLEVTVECAHLLGYLTEGGSPARTPAPDSSFVEGDYTFYRPVLEMRVTAFEGSFEEWQAGESWSLTLEEI